MAVNCVLVSGSGAFGAAVEFTSNSLFSIVATLLLGDEFL
jgi:hypothetical protein